MKTKTTRKRKTKRGQLKVPKHQIVHPATPLPAVTNPTPTPVEDNEIPKGFEVKVSGPKDPEFGKLGEMIQATIKDLNDSKWVQREFRCPADWWEAFKDRWFPKWALKRWPVEWEVRKWMERLPGAGNDQQVGVFASKSLSPSDFVATSDLAQ